MTIGQEFLQELILESKVTRNYLASVPFEQKEFQPNGKSEKLGRLAIHVAEITAWWTACAEEDELNFIDFEPKNINTRAELLAYFDELLMNATRSLSIIKDEELEREWSMTYGDEVLFVLPKKQVMRIFCMNHLVHHRAQLGVYLRLLGVSIPASYGPSADDENVLLIKGF